MATLAVDATLLDNVGLGGLSESVTTELLAWVHETLEVRVGKRLARKMTDLQLDAFERFLDENDEKGALSWLERNIPDYKDEVADELSLIERELANDAERILAVLEDMGQDER